MITSGLVVLVMTPILRVAAALWLYVRVRDYVFAAISLSVLVVLALGVWLGRAH